MRHCFKKKEGYVSILFLILTGILLPLGLFFMIELLHGYNSKDAMQDLIDNGVNAALFQVDKDRLADGEIALNESEAIESAGRVMHTGWNTEVSQATPIYSIKTVASGQVASNSGTYEAEYPTVLIESSFKGKGIFFSRFNNIQNESASHISWGEQKDEEEPISNPSTDGVNVETISVVNPVSYPNQVGFPAMNATNLQLLAHSRLSLAISSVENIEGGTVSLITEGNDVVGTAVVPAGGGVVSLYIEEDTKKEEVVRLVLNLTLQKAEGSEAYEKVTESYGEIKGNTNELLQVTRAKKE